MAAKEITVQASNLSYGFLSNSARSRWDPVFRYDEFAIMLCQLEHDTYNGWYSRRVTNFSDC